MMVLEKKSEERKKVSPAKKKIYSHLSLFFPGPSMFYVTLLRVDSVVVHLSYLLSLSCVSGVFSRELRRYSASTTRKSTANVQFRSITSRRV